MNIKHLPFFLLAFFVNAEAFSQLTESEEELIAPSLSLSPKLNYSIELNLKGVGSNTDDLPFWLYHNQRGRLSKDSNISTWASGKTVTFLSRESYLIFGAGVLYQDGSSEGVEIDELYGHFQNTWMYATVGRKQRPVFYNGLSSSNENILWSLNARPMPGIQLGTSRPIFPFSEEGFGFEGSWNEYLMGNDRYVEGTRLHHKNLRFVFQNGSWQVKAGIQHFVQWAGTSPRMGPQPDSFQDYLRIISGQAGGEGATEGDQLNGLGNTIGGYEFYLRKGFRDFEIQVFYNHLFEDGSGRRLGNTPDGRYGIFYDHNDKDRFISSVMYEFYYTEHQSHTTSGVHKYDNYLNNGTYMSGWTYEGRTIGAPFFLENENGVGIANNKFKAHHIGIGGQLSNFFNTFPYRLLMSFARNDGRYNLRYRPKQNVFHGLFDVGILRTTIDLNVQAGVELNNTASPKFGAGVHLVYKL